MASSELDDEVEVMLALSLSADGASGPCPMPEEIGAWFDGSLDLGRSAQVKSHVARCDACFKVWTQLLDTLGPAEDEARPAPAAARTRSGRVAWLHGWPAWLGAGGFATAFATFVGISVILPMWHDAQLRDGIAAGYAALGAEAAGLEVPERWPWPGGLAVRGGAGAAHDPGAKVAGAAFRAGVAAGARDLSGGSDFWRRIASEVPDVTTACSGSALARCDDAATLFASLGRWAFLVDLACDVSHARGDAEPTPPLDTAFWNRQARVLARFDQRLAADHESTPYGRLFSDWAARMQEGDPQTVLCERSTTLVSLGFME